MTTTKTVSNTAQLVAAMKAAVTSTTPETILLTAGTYTALSVSGDNFASTVTLQSADTKNEAVLDGMTISNSSNLTIQSLNISGAATPMSQYGSVSSGAAGENTHVGMFNNDSSIFLNELTCVGVAGGTLANTPSCFEVENSNDFNIYNSTFTDFHYAIGFYDNHGFAVKDSTFSNLFDDSIRGGGTSDALITGNTMTSNHMDASDTDHPDCIQFWTSGDTTSECNITITDNTYTRGAGNPVQGVFVTDQVGDLPYKNLTIENNNIQGGGYNGVTVQDAEDVQIENNTVQPYDGQPSYMTLTDLSSGTVSGNAVGLMKWEGTNSVTASNNTTLASEPAPGPSAMASSMSAVAPATSSSSSSGMSMSTTSTPSPSVVTAPGQG